ncbi:MAG: hypothetical protein KGI33_03595 [Thaumarchaeota archaeon]|nr:hypothetical protein [Nitrososphaerota archaeon]
MKKKLIYVSLSTTSLIVIILFFLVENEIQINETPVSSSLNFSFFSRGEQQYDVANFQPNISKRTSFDGVTFMYEGNSSGVDECQSLPYQNQTELKDFQVILKNGQIINAKLCWPPSQWYVPAKYLNNSLGTSPSLRYAIHWFDENYTTAVAACNSNICPYGSAIYLVKVQVEPKNAS